MTEIGHNSGEVLNETAQSQLKSIIERIERLNEEKAEIAEQIKEVYAEAKGNGFDTKTIRRTVKAKSIDRATGQEARALLELYCGALGDPALAELI